MLAKYRRTGYLFMLALLIGTMLPLATSNTAYAQEEEFGYYWRLDFDFEKSFNALLTIEVGPWMDGEMTEVTETSTATVHCEPRGDVILDGGDAVFNGKGYLACNMDLAAIVFANHGLEIAETDVYGSIEAETQVVSAGSGYAPIFKHKDGLYALDFNASSSVTLYQELWNGAGSLQANYAGVHGMSWNTYYYNFACNPSGTDCNAFFKANGDQQVILDIGNKTQWSTGPNRFLIGSDGKSFFTGRMAYLFVDPGNSMH